MYPNDIIVDSQKARMVVNEVVNDLQLQASKLTSQRLHLQALIAKRDRLDFEIRNLKKMIRKSRKATTRKENLREEAIDLLRTSDPETKIIVPDSEFEEFARRVEVILHQLRSEEDLIDTLNRLPRLDED